MSDIVERLRYGPWSAELKRESIDEIERLRAELREAREHRQFLWDLLDNIDTLDDACKSEDKLFRDCARLQQKRRWEISESDGYEVAFLAK